MVLSKIDKQVNYDENEKIDDNDLNHDAALFEFNILDKDIKVAIGKPNTNYLDNNIIFFSLYLVFNNKIVSKIGLYEVEGNKVQDFLDSDSDLNIELLNIPLLFAFVSEEYLIQKTTVNDDISDESKIKDDTNTPVIKRIVNVKENYDESKAETWVEKFMESNKYVIKDNDGGGDCLFYVIQDAVSEVDPSIDVKSTRKLLSDNASDNEFNGYKELYDSYNDSIRKDTAKLKQLKKDNDELIEQMKITKDRNYQIELVKKGKEIKAEYAKIQKEKNTSNELLKEFKFMKGIKNLSDFKKKIQTCDFWGDTWSISTLERLLNIKLVLFSHEAFESGDKDGVLQCGQLNDKVLENKGVFKPKYYILADYNGYHYKLIKYDNKNILTFEELTDKIKEMVVLKCMEGTGGVYNLIPKFVEYKKLIQTSPEDNDEKMDMENVESSSYGLYDSGTVFQFYSKSGDKPLPGKGSGEKIEKENIKEFSKLASIPSWRRKLSNFWESEFELDGKKWLSVEHYYQGSKFKNNNNEYYLQFSVDSGSVLSKDSVMAKAAGGKTGKLSGKRIRPPDINIDQDFFSSGRSIVEMKKAQQAKFTQSDELKELLKETKNARLMHYSRGTLPIEFTNLMTIRGEITT